jgi:hypothetical protein
VIDGLLPTLTGLYTDPAAEAAGATTSTAPASTTTAKPKD